MIFSKLYDKESKRVQKRILFTGILESFSGLLRRLLFQPKSYIKSREEIVNLTKKLTTNIEKTIDLKEIINNKVKIFERLNGTDDTRY